jgi:hypothetical protein
MKKGDDEEGRGGWRLEGKNEGRIVAVGRYSRKECQSQEELQFMRTT